MNTPTFSTVAQTGNYGDLKNLPSLSAVATSGQYGDVLNKPALATVATSGSYNDLSNKPTISSGSGGPKTYIGESRATGGGTTGYSVTLQGGTQYWTFSCAPYITTPPSNGNSTTNNLGAHGPYCVNMYVDGQIYGYSTMLWPGSYQYAVTLPDSFQTTLAAVNHTFGVGLNVDASSYAQLNNETFWHYTMIEF